MVHNLDLKIVVEGVESLAKSNDWEQLKCDIIQGFLLNLIYIEDTLNEVEKVFQKKT